MILGIAKYRVAFISQRRHDARIRGESRRKHERRLRTLERSKLSFQLRMRFTPPTHERTSAAAPALALTRSSRGLNQPFNHDVGELGNRGTQIVDPFPRVVIGNRRRQE